MRTTVLVAYSVVIAADEPRPRRVHIAKSGDPSALCGYGPTVYIGADSVLTPDGTVTELDTVPDDRGAVLMSRCGKKAAGQLLDRRTWDEYPPASAPW